MRPLLRGVINRPTVLQSRSGNLRPKPLASTIAYQSRPSMATITNGQSHAASREDGAANGAGTSDASGWASPGSAAFDFRSDVMTKPTASMLAAINSTSLQDDVFREDTTTNSLQSFIAALTNFPAALLVLSGTMGNQLCIRTHLAAPPHGVLADTRSHVMIYEAGGMASLSGAFAQPVRPTNGRYLTLEDVQAHAVLSADVHACPTRIVSLENTLNGTVMPLRECRRISEWARAQGLIMHLDGARLWEAVASGAGSLADYCACFDSVSLCFSKGLGAPIGSIVVGSEAFIRRATWVRKSIGGGLRQSGVIAAPARVAVEETFLGGKLAQSHANAKRVGQMWQDLGGKLVEPVETNMVWADVSDIPQELWEATGAKYGLKLSRGRMVIHYQIAEESINRLGKVFEEVLAR